MMQESYRKIDAEALERVESCSCPACRPKPDPELVRRALDDPESFVGKKVTFTTVVRVYSQTDREKLATDQMVMQVDKVDDGCLQGTITSIPNFSRWERYRGFTYGCRAEIPAEIIEAVSA